MILISANVKLVNAPIIKGDFIANGNWCTLTIGDRPHMCQISNRNADTIYINKETEIIISLLSGELSIEYFTQGKEFVLRRGSINIGNGIIKEILEMYIEKKILNDESPMRIKEIINYAEKLPNALIFEDVYDLLK